MLFWMMLAMVYRIDAYLVDPDAYELRRDGVLVPVEPQVFDLLVLLIANRQRPLSKDEIIEKVWDGRSVSDATLSSRIRTARQVLGDDGSTQRLIRTIHGRGFRFVGNVEEVYPAIANTTDRQERAIVRRTEEGGAKASDERAGLGAGGVITALFSPSRRWATAAVALAVASCAGAVALYLLSQSTDSSEVRRQQPEGRSATAAPYAARPTFRDCDQCPEMVVVPEGFFLMGGAPADQRRWNVELPQHLVRIAKQFAIGNYEVTFDEFAAFVDATGHQPASRCNVFVLDLDRWVGTSTTFRDRTTRKAARIQSHA